MRREAHWALLAVAIGSGGCSSFERRWQQAALAGDRGSASRWAGRWTSDHHRQPWGGPAGGQLRCILSEFPGGSARAQVHARWLCFAGDYDVTLQRTGPRSAKALAPAVREYAGSQQLPAIFGGRYQYHARISREHFQASYSSKYDAGTFEMSRQLTNLREFH